MADYGPRVHPWQLVDTLGSAQFGTTMTTGDHSVVAAGSKAAAAQALPTLDALAGGAGRALECIAHLHVPAGAELGALVPSGTPPLSLDALLFALRCFRLSIHTGFCLSFCSLQLQPTAPPPQKKNRLDLCRTFLRPCLF